MEDNIDNALEFLFKLFERLFPFAMLMAVIAIISILLISVFNQDFALKVAYINVLIGLIPLSIVLLLITILTLIKWIIYDED